MQHMDDRRWTRRDLGAAGVGAVALVATSTTADAKTRPPANFDPAIRYRERARELRDFLRVQGDLSGALAPWWWSGYCVGVTPTENPRVLFACEGCETKKVIRRGAGQFEVWSKVMTCFKDPQTLEILNGREFLNPYTNMVNQVEPNITGSKTLYSVAADGQIMAKPLEGGMAEAALTPVWLRNGDKVQVSAARKYPQKRPIPLAEFGTQTVDLAALLDDRLERVEAVFAATFIAPWQRFLAMPQQAGHAVWHAVGRKARGFDELSPAYLEQARKYIPDVLAWSPA